ncbi:MAG: FAD-binding oxidoreductase [Chloroflexi bacterium]|nr:FAD-binding oxidoreductase [Chloroflexota bacterium]
MINNEYGRVTRRVIGELAALVGRDNILTGKLEMEGYSRDEMPLVEPHAPEVVVKPVDNHAIARLMDFANRQKVPVTPRGGGTGLSGGCMPVYGGIVLSLERMNRVLEIDRENFVAVAEPGVALADLRSQVEAQGLYYPLYPGEMTATIGGNTATNAGGMNAIRYGVTRHNVLGLEAVLPNGEIIRSGGKFVKCSSGYDLTQLIAGSEGTLAVITRVILKLTTQPARREVLLAPFENLENAVEAVPEILRLKTTPTGIEFMERGIIEIIEKYLDREMPCHQYAAFLMIIMDGETEDEIYDYFDRVEQICKRHRAIEAMVPGSERAKRRLLESREKFYHAIKKYAPMEIIDVVVPRSQIARFIKEVKAISARHEVPVIGYGHAGDGNVHLHPVCLNMGKEEWRKRLPALMSEVYRVGTSLGGAVSGEHGIGFDKKAHFRSQTDEAVLALMKQIKKAFDPNNILNPGKIFDL